MQIALKDAMIFYIRKQWSSDASSWRVEAGDILDMAYRLEQTMTSDSGRYI